MAQSKLSSVIEVITNSVIGIITALLTQSAIYPLFGIYITTSSNVLITLIFTSISILRGYIVRRWFNSKKFSDWIETKMASYLKTIRRKRLAAVQQNGHAIEYLKNPSEEVQLAAVRQDWESIAYIKNPSMEVQLAAVRQDWRAIQFIKNPSTEVQLTAVQQNGHALLFIKNPSLEVQLEAVLQDTAAIKCIHHPSEEIQLIAALSRDYND